MILAQLVAAFGLVTLSCIFVYKMSEHLLKGHCGDALFSSSYYLRDLPGFACLTAFVLSTSFTGYMLTASHITNIVILAAILSAGYYVTFRGILLTVFSVRFQKILRTRYGHTERVCFDGALARYHSGGVPSYVGSHLHQQMRTSDRVGLPIGVVWVIFILTCLSYLPTIWIQGLLFSGGVSLYCSILSTLTLLPQSDEDSVLSIWKGSPYSCAFPPIVFLILFTVLTPFSCQVSVWTVDSLTI